VSKLKITIFFYSFLSLSKLKWQEEEDHALVQDVLVQVPVVDPTDVDTTSVLPLVLVLTRDVLDVQESPESQERVQESQENLNTNNAVNSLDFLNNNDYVFDENIINLIQNNIIPEFYQYQYDDNLDNYYRFIIISLLRRNYAIEDIYNNLCFYISYIIETDIEYEINIIKNQIRSLFDNNNRIMTNIRFNQIVNNLMNIRNYTDIFNDVLSLINQNNQDANNLESVKLILYDDEINKIPTNKYKNLNNNLKKDNPKCVICQFEFYKLSKVSIVKCNHVYHTKCINKWLSEVNYKCPICREQCGEYYPKNS